MNLVTNEKLEILKRDLNDYSDLSLLAVLYDRMNELTLRIVGDPIEEKTIQPVNEPEEPVTPNEYNIRCSTCGKHSTVPFKPDSTRAVDCKACYDMKRRNR